MHLLLADYFILIVNSCFYHIKSFCFELNNNYKMLLFIIDCNEAKFNCLILNIE